MVLLFLSKNRNTAESGTEFVASTEYTQISFLHKCIHDKTSVLSKYLSEALKRMPYTNSRA